MLRNIRLNARALVAAGIALAALSVLLWSVRRGIGDDLAPIVLPAEPIPVQDVVPGPPDPPPEPRPEPAAAPPPEPPPDPAPAPGGDDAGEGDDDDDDGGGDD
jgi:hypothetical protein